MVTLMREIVVEVVQFLEYILKVKPPNSAGGLDVRVKEMNQG